MDDEVDSHQQLTLVDDVVMSEQGSASPESDNEEVPEFPDRIMRVRSHCENFQPSTYELVTEVT